VKDKEAKLSNIEKKLKEVEDHCSALEIEKEKWNSIE